MSNLVQNNNIMFPPEKIKLLKDTVCKGASDNELQLFLHVCDKTGLDPFMKQIYSIPRGGSRTIQVGVDGFRLIAERTGKYSPGKEPSYVYNDKGAIISATSYVRKMTPDGTWHDVSATAYMAEYYAKSPFWDKMPHGQLAKCAESLALRKAFPAELSGLYTTEEMQQAGANESLELQPIQINCNDSLQEPESIVVQAEIKGFLSSLDSDGPIDKKTMDLMEEYLLKYCSYWNKSLWKGYCDYKNDSDKFVDDFTRWQNKHGK